MRTLDGKKFMLPGSKSKRGLIYSPNNEEPDYERRDVKWVRVGDANVLCPICGKPDWCRVSPDNPANPSAALCSRISEGANRVISENNYLHIIDAERNQRICGRDAIAPNKLPVIIVEGFSDTATAIDMGFSAIGRPSAEGGMALLPKLVKGRDVIIIGDNDAGAGKRGAETTLRTIYKYCSNVIKIMPPGQFKDLRQWRGQIGLTQEQLIKWAVDNGEDTQDSDILPSDIAHTIADEWIKRERTEDGLPTIVCYHGQWMTYDDGTYKLSEREEFRGQIYKFLTGKSFEGIDSSGAPCLKLYKPTRAKVSDIVDALSDWCTITVEPPAWLKDKGLPVPSSLIAFKNGILNVDEYAKGIIKLYKPTPALFSMNILPYDFNEDANSSLWDNFLQDIFNGDADKIELLSQWFGYNCVPDMSMEKLMLMIGRPRSGKGTVVNALANVLGQGQCVSTSFQTLCTEFGYQPLIGKLAALLSDSKVPKPHEAEMALEKILQVVGRDPVGIRRMYLPYLSQVYLSCRFTIAMNDLPNIPDQANALEPRLNTLHFPNSYVGKEDPTLKFRLQEEAAKGKLINFALRGLINLRKGHRFAVPDSSEKMLDQLRELTTPVTAFIKDCCEFPGSEDNPKDFMVSKDDMYAAWVGWCEAQGRKFKGMKEQFGRWFVTSCPSVATLRTMLNGRRLYAYGGVRLSNWALEDYLEKP